MNLAGWHIHLDILEQALEGKSYDWEKDWETHGLPRWEELHKRYLASVGSG
jgi:hypothetical protein